MGAGWLPTRTPLNNILADTGPLYALADESDEWHVRVRTFLEEFSPRLVVPVTVLPEVTYLLSKFLGSSAEIQFVESVHRGELLLEAVTRADLARSIEVMRRYVDAELGFVDASVVAVAERLRLTNVLTVDRKHFGMVRPRHCRAFSLYP
ncbi:MAG TPA: PIN domain-containing protein [Vicinamibacteria bacterium]|nr:PIN domain-containing protein [Vicinamibacteria bacterium]